MKIAVYHPDHETGETVHVANVRCTHTNSVETALEYAYTATQNIGGSWSKGKHLEIGGFIEDNYDYNPDVEVVAELPVYNGQTYGLRSSMTNDIFIVNDELEYKCDTFGFERIK